MCETKYISNLYVNKSAENVVQVTMRRSDGNIFVSAITLASRVDAGYVKQLLRYIEDLRTCACTQTSKCEKHKDLR